MSSGSGSRLHTRKLKKPMSGLDDALESLHSEPSGWGDLPSPKPTDVDNGTEIWGVAPDDIHRKIKHANGTTHACVSLTAHRKTQSIITSHVHTRCTCSTIYNFIACTYVRVLPVIVIIQVGRQSLHENDL